MKNKLTNNLNTFKIPKPILFTGKLLQLISTNLTVNFVAKIFSTPLKFKIPEGELMMRKSAKNIFLRIPQNKKDVMVYSYGFSRKKILLVHGWTGRGTQLHHLANKILENKMMVISFDAPAHGLSSGKTANMLDYIESIQEIDKKYGPFEAIIGHSFGAMSALNAIASGLKTNKLVTIGADDSIPEIFKSFIKKMELKPIIATKLEKLYQKKYKANIDDFSSYRVAKKVSTPTLIIHDSEDKYVSVSSALTIRQNLKNGQILITHGLGHHKIFKDKNVINQIIKFIQ